MNVETHVKIINNVFLWLMAFESDTVTHLHFLASNQIVENTLMTSLQGFKEVIQLRTAEEAENESEIIGEEQTDLPEVETDQDIDITREDTIRPLQLPHNVMSADSASTFNGQRNDITSEDTIKPTIFYRNENATSNGTMEGHSRYDDYPNNSPRTDSIISSECSEEGLTYIKSVDKFPEKESIWKYYVGSKEDFKTISNKKRPRTVKIDEEALEYDFETGRPVRRTLSQSSVDETPLDHKNFEPKRKIKRRQRRKQPTKVQQTNPSPETPPQPFFCSICQNTKDESCKRVLQKCGHSFCSDCIKKYFEDVSPSCPNCKEFYGVPLGNQPYGVMSHRIVNQYLPGYPGTDTIIIEYDIPDGIQSEKHPNPGVKFKGTTRTAFLPYNEKGCKVHRMLQKAFSQQLIFTVGKSVTTGKENVVTWNDIHHKTRADGGPERYGYPDPDYLDRVLEQLRRAGITDIDD